MIKHVHQSAVRIVMATKADPVPGVAVVLLFFLLFNLFEATVEAAIWGEPFAHWLDPFFAMAFMIYAAYITYLCSEVNK